MSKAHFRLLAAPEETVSGDMIYQVLSHLAKHRGQEVYYISEGMKRRYAGERAKGSLVDRRFKEFHTSDEDLDVNVWEFFPTRSMDIMINFYDDTPAFTAQLTAELVAICNQFVQVWQAYFQNNDYYHRQTAFQIERYERSGWPKPDLPLVDKTVNPKYPRLYYDISFNPGHFKFKPGFVEIPTADLWASDHWLDKLGVNYEDLLALTIETPKAVAPGICHYRFYDRPFDSDEGEQKDIQIKLRRVLFHTELGDRDGLNF